MVETPVVLCHLLVRPAGVGNGVGLGWLEGPTQRRLFLHGSLK